MATLIGFFLAGKDVLRSCSPATTTDARDTHHSDGADFARIHHPHDDDGDDPRSLGSAILG